MHDSNPRRTGIIPDGVEASRRRVDCTGYWGSSHGSQGDDGEVHTHANAHAVNRTHGNQRRTQHRGEYSDEYTVFSLSSLRLRISSAPDSPIDNAEDDKSAFRPDERPDERGDGYNKRSGGHHRERTYRYKY